MFNKEDILARLQKGETADSIADEMAAALNAATAAFAEEEVKATAVIEAKRQSIQNVLAALCDYCMVSGAEEGLVDELRKGLDNNEELDAIAVKLDQLIELGNAIAKLAVLEYEIPEVEKKESCGSPSCDCKIQTHSVKPTFEFGATVVDPDIIIKNFLKSI